MSGRWVIASALFLTLPLGAVARQVRDAATVAAPAGTASIRGVVVSADAAPRPLRRALVTLGGGKGESQSVVSDDAGRFAVADLAAGTYTVSVTKGAYLAAAYGAPGPGRPGTPIVLTSGQSLDIVIRLTRGAVVSGVIRDRRGAPLAGARVASLNLRAAGSPDDLSTAEVVTTDDRGAYRIFGLAPSEYVVAAVPRAPARGAIGVRTAAEIDAIFMRLQQRAAPMAPLPSAAPYAHAPTYFPGAPQLGDATRIGLVQGEERAGLDFSVLPVRSWVVEGSVQGPVGSLSAVQFSLVVGGPRLPAAFGASPTLAGRPDAQGRFKYTNMTPGQYTVIARGNATASTGGGRGGGGSVAELPVSGIARVGDATDTSGWLYALADVSVVAQDVTGVTLTMVPGSTFSGRVAFDRTTAATPPDLTKIILRIAPPAGTGRVTTDGTTMIGNLFGAMPLVPLRSDGSFVVAGIGPGSYGLFTVLPPEMEQRWWLRSAVVDGRDLLDVGFDVRPGRDLANAVLTFSDRRTEISGSLSTATGLPAPEPVVIVFPADPSLRRPYSRRVKTTRPATDGTFALLDLPAGDYVIVALTDVTPNAWNDPKFLESIAGAGVPVTLGEGEKKRQDLRLVR